MNLRFSSYNCRSVKNCHFSVNELTRVSDVVCLQETWLPVQESDYLSSINSEFTYYAVSPVDLSNHLLTGRPFGGVAFLYRKNLASCIQRIDISNDRIICIDMKLDDNCIRVINCYLPYFNGYNDAEYIDCLAKIHCLITEHPNGNVLVVGDFNAHTQSRFGNELKNFCTSYDYCICDVELMPHDTYTWISDATGHTRWLDHVVCPPRLLSYIRDMRVLHSVIGSDHRPISFSLTVTQLPKIEENSFDSRKTKFNVTDSVSYKTKTERLLKSIELPLEALRCSSRSCRDENHLKDIKNFLSAIVNALQLSSECKESKDRTFKPVPGWNDHVKEHHHEAREDYLAWKELDKPREGLIYDKMNFSKAQFKRALNFCKENEEEIISNKIASNLKGDIRKFWDEIDKKRKTHASLPVVVNNVSGTKNIAELWREHYSKLFNDPSHPNTPELEGNCNEHFVDTNVDEISAALKSLNPASSPGHDGLTLKHITEAHPVIRILLSFFATCCFRHSYLPDILILVLLVPLIKDKNGNHSDISNYRPIALATIISKVIEAILLERCKKYLKTSDNQFAYKSGHGTEMPVHILKHVTEEYNERKTPVYACFMDMSKAFDKISHKKLFEILLKRDVPTYIISILGEWYKNQQMSVKWGDAFSDKFPTSCGVRQGSLLSPYLFNVYMDELSEKLQQIKVGCYLNAMILNHIFYADDIVLFAPSVNGLQQLVNICTKFMSERFLSLNVNKTKCMVFSKTRIMTNQLSPIVINEANVEFVTKIKYLGYHFENKNADDDHTTQLYRSLCTRSNMILRNFSKCNQDVKKMLFQSFCTSFYCMSLVVRVKQRTINRLKVCYNDSLRRLMGIRRNESVSAHFVRLGLPSYPEMRRKLITSYLQRIRNSENSIIQQIVNPVYFHNTMIFGYWRKLVYT